MADVNQNQKGGVVNSSKLPKVGGNAEDKKRTWLGAYLLIIPILLLLCIINFWPIKHDSPDNGNKVKNKVKVEAVKSGESQTQQIPKDNDNSDSGNGNQNSNEGIKKSDAEKGWSNKMVFLGGTISFELRILILICLAGMMGSYIHTATSFAYHMGADDFQPSWYWWYLMRLPIGAGLAFVFILLFRSGFYVMQNNDPNSLTDPIATIGLAALVGLFAPQALDKLGDIFTVVFNPKDRTTKKNDNNNGNNNDA